MVSAWVSLSFSPPWSICASPKSATFTTPLSVSMMFSGLMSRCTIPLAEAASRAAAVCRMTCSAAVTAMRLPCEVSFWR